MSRSIRNILDNSFQNCSGLKGELVIPDSTKSIGKMAFYNCTGLDKLNIQSAFIQIDDKAFDSTDLSVVSFGGTSNIHCGLDVFPKGQKLSLPSNYISDDFCGINIKSDSTDIETVSPDIETISPNIETDSTNSNNPDSNSKKKSLSTTTIIIIVICCVCVVIIIALVVVIFLIKKNHKISHISDTYDENSVGI